MSCCGPHVTKLIYQCPSSEEGATYTFSNVNVSGQGVFSGISGSDVQFKGIASAGGTIDVTNDAPNKTINIEANTAAIVAAIPVGTTATQGTARLATDAQAIAKAATDRVLTPSNLAALGASTTFAGFTRFATSAATILGVETDTAVTPAGLNATLDQFPTMQLFATNAARLAATPAFIGQIGVQQDTAVPWIGSNTIAGSFDVRLFAFGIVNAGTDTEIDLSNGELSITNLDATAKYFNFSNGGILNFTNTGRLYANNAAVPASSVVTTTTTAGQVESKLISDFISNSNVSDVYTLGTYTERRTVPNAATITTQEATDVLCTLLSDLFATLKPTDTV